MGVLDQLKSFRLGCICVTDKFDEPVYVSTLTCIHNWLVEHRSFNYRKEIKVTISDTANEILNAFKIFFLCLVFLRVCNFHCQQAITKSSKFGTPTEKQEFKNDMRFLHEYQDTGTIDYAIHLFTNKWNDKNSTVMDWFSKHWLSKKI